METRPIFVFIAVALICAAGAKWVHQSVLTDGHQASHHAATDHQNSDDHIQHQAGSIASTKLPLTDLNASQQASDLINSAVHPVHQYPLNDPLRLFPNTPQRLASNRVTDNDTTAVYKLLADQGIRLIGIDEHSSHIDALFAAYFDLDGSSNNLALDIIIGSWVKTHPADAWQWIENNDTTGVLHRFHPTIIQQWLPIDADAALLAITSLAESPEKDNLLADYGAFIAAEEPDRAFFWAYGLTNEQSRRAVLDRVVYEWASSDAEAAVVHLDSITDLQTRQQLLFQAGPAISANLIQTDAQQALTWVTSLGGDVQTYLSPIAFHQWVNKNPEAALDWLVAQQYEVNVDLFMSSAASTLAYQNLPEAMRIFPSMSTNVQQSMASSIAFSMYQIDSNLAMNWINNQSSINVRHNANRGILKASVLHEPELALQMALELLVGNTSGDAAEVLVSTAIEVDQQHPGLVETWLTTAPITDVQLDDIQEALIRTPPD